MPTIYVLPTTNLDFCATRMRLTSDESLRWLKTNETHLSNHQPSETMKNNPAFWRSSKTTRNYFTALVCALVREDSILPALHAPCAIVLKTLTYGVPKLHEAKPRRTPNSAVTPNQAMARMRLMLTRVRDDIKLTYLAHTRDRPRGRLAISANFARINRKRTSLD